MIDQDEVLLVAALSASAPWLTLLPSFTQTDAGASGLPPVDMLGPPSIAVGVFVPSGTTDDIGIGLLDPSSGVAAKLMN